mmetsp:Transcript_14530/g.57080  ORF Transcript_14530/g.57080 Transcript_14530/m.57080 type:complete len:239 (-) Transcript_14530:619-1335(-)
MHVVAILTMDWQLEYLGATGGVVGREEAVELQLGPAETLRVQPQIWLVGERTMSAKEECSSDGVVIADDHRQVSCLAVGEATVTGKLCNLAQCEVASTNEVVRNAVLGEVLAGCEELIWLEFSFHLALDGAVSEAFPWNVGSKAGRDDGVVRGVDGRAAEHICAAGARHTMAVFHTTTYLHHCCCSVKFGEKEVSRGMDAISNTVRGQLVTNEAHTVRLLRSCHVGTRETTAEFKPPL